MKLIVDRLLKFHLLQKPRRCLNSVYFGLPRSKTSTYHDFYTEWVQKFKEAEIPEPEESSGYIVAHMLGRKTFSVVPDYELQKTLSENHAEYLNDLCLQRLERVPVQYIIGEWDFYGINLRMKPPVFIPRPETEQLAEFVSQNIEEKLMNGTLDSACRVLEVGCGSGAITLALLNKFKDEQVEFIAIDAADHAVNLTLENAALLGFSDNGNKLKVFHHKLTQLSDSFVMTNGPGHFDIIVSNPPYVPTADMKELPIEIARYEDEEALHGGETGLDVVEIILKVARNILAKNGSIWLELDSSHPRVMANRFPGWNVKAYKDLFQTNRFCKMTIADDYTCTSTYLQ